MNNQSGDMTQDTLKTQPDMTPADKAIANEHVITRNIAVPEEYLAESHTWQQTEVEALTQYQYIRLQYMVLRK